MEKANGAALMAVIPPGAEFDGKHEMAIKLEGEMHDAMLRYANFCGGHRGLSWFLMDASAAAREAAGWVFGSQPGGGNKRGRGAGPREGMGGAMAREEAGAAREQTTLRLPAGTLERLRREAADRGYTATDLIMFAISDYMEARCICETSPPKGDHDSQRT
jgi:hypothetical protein